MRALPLTLVALALACPGEPASTTDETGTSTTDAVSTATGDALTTTTTTTTAPTTGDPPEPVCCGCLCLDPGWSCAADTCLLPDGSAAALGPEAGFLAISPHTFSYFDGPDEIVAEATEARLWYVFQPADEAPETRPLVVFFNGGPGSSTAILFGLNTGRRTADPDLAGPAVVADNPHSWTRFANLLHVDPRETGFSYDFAPPDGPRPEPSPFFPEHDAAYVSQFILKFLERHPQLEKNPVLLVGESYGGVRAALISQQLTYPEELLHGGDYRNPQLHAALRAHLERTVADLPPGPLGSAAAAQFGARVLVQPLIAFNLQEGTPHEEQAELLGCVAGPDFNQCDQPEGWSTERIDAAIMALLDPTTLSAMTGVDATTIDWLYADARAGAYPRASGQHDTSALAAVFGAPAPGDDIYLGQFARFGLGVAKYGWTNARYGYAFLRTLPAVRTFITNAGKDINVYAPDIPARLAAYPDVIESAVHETEGDEPRPGRIVVRYRPELGLPEPEYPVRFPFYPLAGHMVTHRQPGELLADVEAWFYAE